MSDAAHALARPGVPPSLLASRRAILERVRQGQRALRNHIRDAFPEETRALERLKAELRRVVLVLGGARCGTSAFKGVLVRNGAALALPGEHRPYFTVLGRNFPDHGLWTECNPDSPLTSRERDELIDMLLVSSQAGPVLDEPGRSEIDRFAWEWALRLPLQWPQADVSAERVVAAVTDATRRFIATGAHCTSPDFDAVILTALRGLDPNIDPMLYDLDPALLERHFPHAPLPEQPFSPVIIEITPFVLPKPRLLKSPAMRIEALVLKASSDAYRLATLRQLFSGYRRTCIQLTRNPLAAVNGLIDGWHHHGFWQHHVAFVPGVPKQRHWWCFDLMNDWQSHAHDDDVQLAAGQWRDSNRLILDAAQAPVGGETWHRLAFERFIAGGEVRRDLVREAISLARLPWDYATAAASIDPEKINRTREPKPARWRQRAGKLLPLLRDPAIAALSRQLGYEPRRMESWL